LTEAIDVAPGDLVHNHVVVQQHGAQGVEADDARHCFGRHCDDCLSNLLDVADRTRPSLPCVLVASQQVPAV
jgi:hypothetical protein